jgi:hypothetical protein
VLPRITRVASARCVDNVFYRRAIDARASRARLLQPYYNFDRLAPCSQNGPAVSTDSLLEERELQPPVRFGLCYVHKRPASSRHAAPAQQMPDSQKPHKKRVLMAEPAFHGKVLEWWHARNLVNERGGRYVFLGGEGSCAECCLNSYSPRRRQDLRKTADFYMCSPGATAVTTILVFSTLVNP